MHHACSLRAALSDSSAVVNLLLAAGAAPNARDECGRLPLHMAAQVAPCAGATTR
ncbi:MAG: hypothetical protein F4Z73_05470 [Synechococcus sp. SB0668_bin_13]|nr:hypothetical protein [Synechococcus sp. SB0668_bin_13]